jgi:hypothetical protein
MMDKLKNLEDLVIHNYKNYDMMSEGYCVKSDLLNVIRK